MALVPRTRYITPRGVATDGETMMRASFSWAGLCFLACADGSPADALPAGETPSATSANAMPVATDGSVSERGADASGASSAEAPVVEALDPGTPAPDVAGATAPPAVPIELPSDAPTLVVSLTFDDTFEPQLAAAEILESHGLRGTFYVNSPRLHDGSANAGSSPYMSQAAALRLQARGHEIGGHTLSHPRLTTLPEVERVREVMADRAELVRLGFAALSFAYPSGDAEAETDPTLGLPVLQVLASSGYSSARDTNGFGLNGCSAGPETLPPLDAYRLRSVRSVNDAPPVGDGEPALPPDSAATLLAWMDHAVSCGSGWLPLIFHHLREDCSAPDGPGSFCFNFAELELLAAELAAGARCPEEVGAACYRVAVAPVSTALGHTTVAPAPEVFALRNAALERALESGGTECIQATQGSGGTAIFSRSTLIARSGLSSERVEIAEPYVAPAEIRISRDFGACSPYVNEGRAYDLAVHYQAELGAAAPTLRFVTYRLTSDHVWELWTSGEPFEALTPGQWVRHAVRTESVPAGTIAISHGLRQESVGVIHVDDFEGAPVAATTPVMP
jgi:polysaccharide deacetylase